MMRSNHAWQMSQHPAQAHSQPQVPILKRRELRIEPFLTRAGVTALVESKHLERLAALDVRLAPRDKTSPEMLRRRFGRRRSTHRG